MNVDLYKVSDGRWAVTTGPGKTPLLFNAVENASDCLLSMGIADEYIDAALTEMFAKGTTRANFGYHGEFNFSDSGALSYGV
jgi:hypothetical protein